MEHDRKVHRVRTSEWQHTLNLLALIRAFANQISRQGDIEFWLWEHDPEGPHGQWLAGQSTAHQEMGTALRRLLDDIARRMKLVDATKFQKGDK